MVYVKKEHASLLPGMGLGDLGRNGEERFPVRHTLESNDPKAERMEIARRIMRERRAVLKALSR